MVLGSDMIDWSGVWTFLLASSRMAGLLTTIPGIGTDQVPASLRLPISFVFSIAIALTGYKAPAAESIISASFMLGMEFSLGYILGTIPQFVISALAVAGQVAASTIGLAQASLIDPTIGISVSILAKIQSLVATTLFLLIDGHHLIFRAATGVSQNLALGDFALNESITTFLIDKFAATFEFGILVCSPILVSVLITQFVLGLTTRFVPQINIFIISLPLTIGIGLYILSHSLPELTEHLVDQYTLFEEDSAQVITLGVEHNK